MKKRITSDYLFDEMSGIDDIILTGALMYRPKARKKKIARKILLIAAAVTLTALIMIFQFTAMKKLSKPETQSLNSVLEEAGETLIPGSRDDIEFFDQKMRIAWKYKDSTGYYSRELSDTDGKMLISMSVGNISQTYEEDNIEGLWITLGDGRVVTPYLKKCPGNVGYAELFDYSPEIVPGQSYIEFVRKITSGV